MVEIRLCKICNNSINNRRRDAITCSSSCRGRLFRSNKVKHVLVQFKVPVSTYTDLAIKAFSAKQGINDYLTNLVVTSQ